MKQTFTGTVVSTKMQKTVIVSVERRFRHPFYKKVIVRHNKLKAHNEDPKIAVGDIVTITETRPLSKEKHFIVVKNTKKTT